MSSGQEAPPAAQSHKSQRVLSCVLCQQRKVKCDREFPCSNCIKARVQCVPAMQVPRRRRRRFPERDLLDQIRKYEDLLRQNKIDFEPLQKDLPTFQAATSAENEGHVDAEPMLGSDGSSPTTTVRSGSAHAMKNFRDFWHAMRLGFVDQDLDSDASSEDFAEAVIKTAWDKAFPNDDNLIFGSRQIAIDLSTMHPEPAQVFRLWQLFLDNVNPLLKIIHASTLQGQIIEAISNMKNINPVLEALLFSIYSMAILSLTIDECQAVFGSPKSDLLAKYQFGCQQALLKCGFLRSTDRDTLTALYLYMVSVVPGTDPRCLSPLLGTAMRLAQRMRIDSESACAKCGALEGELRRRLWWALVLFDARIGELADFKPQTLTPLWDCRISLNINDSDLRPEMKEPPAAHARPTEAIYAVVRSELGDFVRNTSFHLAFTAPALEPLAKNVQGDSSGENELTALEKLMEEKYLQYCDEQIPIHLMTIWDTRACLSKFRLLDTYSKSSVSDLSHTGSQGEVAIFAALRLLECDTNIMSSPLTKGFRWMAHYHFPFPAYIHLLKYLKTQPLSEHADPIWDAMSKNFGTRDDGVFPANPGFLTMFIRIILDAWSDREAACAQLPEMLVTPTIVLTLRNMEMKAKSRSEPHSGMQPSNVDSSVSMDDFVTSIPMQFGEFGPYNNSQDIIGMDMDQFNWAAMDLGFGPRQPW